MESQPITQREIVLQAMQQRPHDPWPRGQGHVLLGIPGSPAGQKAYHEPGGGFSPCPGSFGISLAMSLGESSRWMTSDDIPMADIHQCFIWPTDGGVPVLQTTTSHYRISWRMVGQTTWAGDWHRITTAHPMLALIRSVGPAGGPVTRLDWDGDQLIVNRRWIVRFEHADVQIDLVDESNEDWMTARNPVSSLDSTDGWGCARVKFAGDHVRVTIRDTAPYFASPLSYRSVKSQLNMNLPDAEFAASLDAQAANLLMGFVGRQTCPGEPINYPLAWERDGAYSVMAMARCGQIETAKELAVYFGENDFFGGFGAEGDAPGSAINVLATVGLISGDRQFQRWSWPHIKRKLKLIHEMADATEPMLKPWLGPIVPEHHGKPMLPIICQPASNDLIHGSMDLHYPALYINAISYRGIHQAIRIAKKLETENEIDGTAALAERLKRGWHANFHVREHYENSRTFMSGMWPSWITGSDRAAYQAGLEERWRNKHADGTFPKRPLWTYFTVAEAHQWLLLDRPDITWKAMNYLWRNQTSPGLFTFWEGEKEENTFGLWQHLRGWVSPTHVTPHYWTAAELLLLQADMLTYVDESDDEPVLVIGAGVPATWCDHPMSVTGSPTWLGLVDWSYDGKRTVRVKLHGDQPCRIRAGINFPADTAIETNGRPCEVVVSTHSRKEQVHELS